MKRRIIVAITFVAGLYYFLEFLLPPRIGGAPDADGAAGATVVKAQQASLLAYTGLRTDRRPVILSAGLDGQGARNVLISPSFARHDDYRGARSPQFVQPDRLYYIGLGWDDRTPRVCLARLRDGRWRPEPKAVLRDGGPGEPDASGIAWFTVHRVFEGPYRMWYVGTQGDQATVCLAESEDGLTWAKRGRGDLPALRDATVLSISHQDFDTDGPALWALVRLPDGHQQVRLIGLRSDGLAEADPPNRSVIDVPSGLELRDLRREPALTAPWAMLATLGAADAVPHVAALSLPATLPRAGAELRVDNPSLLTPGRRPRSTILSDVRTQVDDILVVIGAFAVGLGLIGLARVHGKRLVALQKGWPESTAFFVAAIAMAAFTVYARTHPDARTWGARGYDLMFYGMLQPLGSSMFSLLAAYLVSAAYRAFRVRSFEGGLLAASALLIMLGQVPIGNWMTQGLPSYLQIPKIMAWVLFVNNNAVVRAVNFGIFLGALATALRVWLSMDRAAMRSVE